MSFNSWKRSTNTKNDFLFNGIERETELDLGWDLAHYRAYDPAIGRWLQIDPKTSERESPYVGFANMPNFYIDPLGDTIRVRGSDEFVKQYESDRAVIAETKGGKELLEFLDGHERDINISEATSVIGAIKDIFSEGSGDKNHVLSSEATIQLSSDGDNANVEYSQINGVEVDGIETESFATLGHELQHAKDIVDGTVNREANSLSPADANTAAEKRAVQFGNMLRQKVGNKQVRTKYAGRQIIFPKTPIKKGGGYRDY